MDAAQSARTLTPDPVRYLVPAGRHGAECTIERSRFLCTLSRASSDTEAHAFVREMQQTYAAATHNCWAFVVGAPASTSHIGLSDDGEPHGTAGRPMLTVLLHSNVGEIVAVVTRWYGGVKLGTGGLARAYSGAVQEALATLPTTWRVDEVELAIVVHYDLVTPLQLLFASLDVVCDEQSYAEQVTYRVRVPRDRESELRARLADLSRRQAHVAAADVPPDATR